jgi:hypothetical protein
VRRPVFWFLWPATEPGPLDGDAVQARWTRVCGRGPWRWGFLIALTAAVVTICSAAVATLLTQPGWLSLLLCFLVVIPLIALLARAWVVGTYVNDRGIKVSSLFTTEVLPWPAVQAITTEEGTRWLGTPLRARGQRVVLRPIDGSTAGIRTHIETASPDLWLRPQAWEAARDRLSTWLREIN